MFVITCHIHTCEVNFSTRSSCTKQSIFLSSQLLTRGLVWLVWTVELTQDKEFPNEFCSSTTPAPRQNVPKFIILIIIEQNWFIKRIQCNYKGMKQNYRKRGEPESRGKDTKWGEQLERRWDFKTKQQKNCNMFFTHLVPLYASSTCATEGDQIACMSNCIDCKCRVLPRCECACVFSDYQTQRKNSRSDHT